MYEPSVYFSDIPGMFFEAITGRRGVANLNKASDFTISDNSIVHDSVICGPGVQVWHYSQVRENVVLGDNVIIGSGVYIGPGVTIGSNSKIQNNASVYDPATIGPGVFIGPGVILTNDKYPRAINPNGTQKRPEDWNAVAVTVSQGASIGAGAVCVAPVHIGKWALVAAGSVVINDVPDFGLVAGNPARFICWVGEKGVPLKEFSPGQFICAETKQTYKLQNGIRLVKL